MPRIAENDPDDYEELDLDNLDAEQDEDSIRRELDQLDEDEDEIESDVKDIFEESQGLAHGRGDLLRKLKNHTDKNPNLSGGDIDASWDYADVGEETVGGQNPTPDQSVVDEEGEAVGLTYQDNEPLAVDDKLGKRDRQPWELNPASSPDYPERVNQEFHAPLETIGITSQKKGGRRPAQRTAGKGAHSPSHAAHRATARAAAHKKTGTRAAKSSRAAGKTRGAKGQTTGRRTARANTKTSARRASSVHPGTRR